MGRQTKNNDGNRKKIPQKVVNLLWIKAAGRCEFAGCNKCLYADDLTKNIFNRSNIAHIVADSPDGPRGDAVRSKQLDQDIRNLMLLCPEHHKMIDTSEYVSEYSELKLQEMKQQHERRIELVSGLTEEKQVHVITYLSNIGDTTPIIDESSVNSALLPNFYPAEVHPIAIEWSGIRNPDFEKYWKEEVANLELMYNSRVMLPSSRWEQKRIALFALAPMPLLVKLGTLLNDKMPVEVYQKHRFPDCWKWGDDVNTNYIINRPENADKKPVLIFSLSYDIAQRVRERYQDTGSIWEIKISEPNNDYLKSKKQLDDFSRIVYDVLADIKKNTRETDIDVFMSMPVACAIQFGRVWMHKADLKLNLYDYDSKFNQDLFAFTISSEE